MESDQPGLTAAENFGAKPTAGLPFEKNTSDKIDRNREPISIPLDGHNAEHHISIEHEEPDYELNQYQTNEINLPPPELDEAPPPIDLSEGHRLGRSEGFLYETTESGELAQKPSFDYHEEFYRELQPETAAEESEEVAVASGQLAVATSDDVDVPSSSDDSSQNYADLLARVREKLIVAIQGGQKLTEKAPSLAIDAILWGIVVVVYIAVIAAIRS